MRVKKLISFYENQHYFTILFVHNFLSRWLNESFRFFCVSYIKILKNWFILQNPSFYSFLWLIGLPVSWRWHHLLYYICHLRWLCLSTGTLRALKAHSPHLAGIPQADNWWENQRWQIHLIQLPLNEQRETTSLWSFPFVRCIHSDYITWLSKWLCMHIIPSFLVDKASCTRQFESELSLHSLASLFPIKEGIFSNSSVSLSKGSSTSNQAFLLRRKDVTALLGAVYAPPVPPLREGPYPIPKP